MKQLDDPPTPGKHQKEPNIEAVASTAKELRRSLSSIHYYTDLMLEETSITISPKQRSILINLQQAIRIMETQIENLFRFAAIEIDTSSLMPEKNDLLYCIDEAVSLASVSLREKELALRMDVPEQIPPLAGEIEPVIKIISHLLDNAIGASPIKEEIILAARVQQVEEAKFVFLTVSDVGEGIPPKDLDRVFQPFDKSDDVPIQGLGVDTEGLSIVKELSEALDGRVWFDSEVGVGSTFTVLMPSVEN
jgi:two-component system phosphate regulon sensor histidine kinase PhoR